MIYWRLSSTYFETRIWAFIAQEKSSISPLNSRVLCSKWTLGFLPNWPKTPVTQQEDYATVSDGWHKGQPQNGERGLKILVLVHLHCSNKPPSTLSKMPGSSGVLEPPGCVTQEKFPPIVIVTLAGASTPQPRPGAPPSGYSFIQTGAYCTEVLEIFGVQEKTLVWT